MCADLKTAAGREIARELVRRADVLVHNYRPGVPERLGLGYDDLHALNPRLVWVSIAGYGRHGSGANRPATHPCAGAAMGGAGYQAASALVAPCETLADVREVARQLMRANESNPDPNTSVVAASATLLALLARERHGVGQAVYVNMLLANGYANADDAVTYAGKPPRLLPDDGLHGLSATYRLYRARTGWVFVAVGSAAEWQRACAVLERPDLASWPMTDDGALGSALATRDADEWERAFVAAGVAVVRADASTPGVFFARHPQMLAQGLRLLGSTPHLAPMQGNLRNRHYPASLTNTHQHARHLLPPPPFRPPCRCRTALLRR